MKLFRSVEQRIKVNQNFTYNLGLYTYRVVVFHGEFAALVVDVNTSIHHTRARLFSTVLLFGPV